HLFALKFQGEKILGEKAFTGENESYQGPGENSNRLGTVAGIKKIKKNFLLSKHRECLPVGYVPGAKKSPSRSSGQPAPLQAGRFVRTAQWLIKQRTAVHFSKNGPLPLLPVWL
ncbi:hypothetical protein, partial [Desulfonatronospira sp.]|uniref:hypothetical protein n=1 Tax=Desulfonatronospira sp. TaxID=1962951 RepID=UPI0025BCAC80